MALMEETGTIPLVLLRRHLELEKGERILINPLFVQDLIKRALQVMTEDQGGQVRERRTLLSDRVKELDRKIQKTGQLVLDDVLTSADAKAMTAPMMLDRDAARAELTTLPEPEGVPRFEDIDVDLFRADILDSSRAREVGIRRTSLDRLITESRLEPGVAHATIHLEGRRIPGTLPTTGRPANAPMSFRLPSA